MSHVTQREKIIKSDAGKRMIAMVSPIYDESYVMCWIFEAIGSQQDILNKYVSELKLQTNLKTVTWGIDLWEKEFGITPREGATLEERRQAIINKIIVRKPLAPFHLESFIEQLTGRDCTVVENTGLYTFGVYIHQKDGAEPVELTEIIKHIELYKPAHLAYELAFQSSEDIKIGVETGYWIYAYPMTGMLPEPNIVYSGEGYSIKAGLNATGYLYAHPMTGMETTGVHPDINTLSGAAEAAIDAAADAAGYGIAYPMAGDGASGQKPEYVLTGTSESSPIRASPSGTAYSITYALCGTINTGAGTL